MANTIRAAKNTFNGGLVMDLAPDTTPNEVLTSALNATLVTFNGNELLLQNDMGNGRVETARLPEGYIPVGTCEFGDIIYIVSYNPLTNRSQIGCFPSPERNISSEEVGSNGQLLSSSDFQEGTGEGENFAPNGELKASSVKKIIYNNKMNPGDKYIIYDNNNSILSEEHISDIGNTSHIYGAFPKLLKIHVVAIEDGGKINYLDSTVKWYNKILNDVAVDYFMMSSTKTLDDPATPDIDSYRDLLSSGYSVFQSKISGKLALLIELEKITGFSCTYNTYTSQKPISISDVTGVIDSSEAVEKPRIMNKECKIYWNINWENDDNNINPKYIVLTKSEWGSKKPSENTERDIKAGHYYLWRKDNLNVINDVKVDISSNIPKAYPEDNYWYAKISRLYDPSSNISYSTFINAKSYDKLLETALIPIKLDYKNQELYKLNLSRKDIKIGDYDYIGLPRDNDDKSYYFINLISIERKADPQASDALDPGATLYTGYISDFTKSEGKTAVNDYTLSDDIVNNYFHTSVSKFFYTFNIPVELNIDGNIYTPDTSNLIYHYEITPAMDYGLLREYSVEGYIDFSKIGTGLIDLTHWKYFNAENISTLTLGLDAYVEENKDIAEIALEFYDNQGYAATYHIRDKESYSGVFTEVIPLNGVIQNANLNDIDAYGKKHTHLGPEATDFAKNVGYVTEVNGQPKYNPLYYKQVDGKVKAYKDNAHTQEYDSTNDGNLVLNDAGIIYGNALYLVKIVVKYCQKDILGNLDTTLDSEFKTYYRWYWTNTIFNEQYPNVNDFDVLQPSLTVDANVAYEMDNSGYQDPQGDAPSGDKTDYQDLQKSAGLTILKMTDQKIKVYVSPYLYNNYNTFKLLGNKGEGVTPTGVYAGLNLKICRGKRYIEQYLSNGSKEPPIQIHTGEYSTSMYTEWEGMKFVPGDTESTNSMLPYHANWRDPVQEGVEGRGGYETLTDDFRVEFTSEGSSYTSNPSDIYIGKDSSYIKKDNYPEKSYGANAIDDGINVFNLNLLHYSKYYIISDYLNKNITAVVPLIKNTDDLEKYNIGIYSAVTGDKKFCAKTHVSLQISGQGEDTGSPNLGFNNKGESNTAYHNSYSMNHDIDKYLSIDVYDIDNVGSKIYKGVFIDAWNDNETCLLSLFEHEGHKKFYYRQNGGSDAEGGITYIRPRDFNPNLTEGDNCLMRPGFFSYNLYWAANGARGIYLNNIGDLDSSSGPDVKIAMQPDPRTLSHGLGFVDKDHNMHFFNSMYNALYLVSLLCQTYIADTTSTQSVLSANDIVYLLDNYTSYTLDVVYEYYHNLSDLSDNEMIVIYEDTNYVKYVNTIIKSIYSDYSRSEDSHDDFINIDVDGINILMNNINFTLKYSLKNVPLEFKMNYKRPDTFSALDLEKSKVLLKTILDITENNTGKLVDSEDPINNLTLYYYNEEYKALMEISGDYQLHLYKIADVKSGNLILLEDNGSFSPIGFHKIFKYSGEYLEFVNKEYSTANTYCSFGLQIGDLRGTIKDILQNDILIELLLLF